MKQFVFASSSSVYGVNPDVPWRETASLLPISPYASTKLSGEMMGHVYSHLYGIRFVALRFFTGFWPAAAARSRHPQAQQMHSEWRTGSASMAMAAVGATIPISTTSSGGVMAAMEYSGQQLRGDQSGRHAILSACSR